MIVNEEGDDILSKNDFYGIKRNAFLAVWRPTAYKGETVDRGHGAVQR